MAQRGERDTVAPSRRPARAVVLRPMRRDDLRAVLEIEKRVFPRPWSRALFDRELRNPRARMVVAVPAAEEEEPAVLGYSSSWVVADEAHLLNLAVHPRYQGAGIGRCLLEAVIDDSRQRGARVVFLEVRAGNIVARRLYRRLGFRDLGVRRGYYGPGQDAIVMELRLAGG